MYSALCKRDNVVNMVSFRAVPINQLDDVGIGDSGTLKGIPFADTSTGQRPAVFGLGVLAAPCPHLLSEDWIIGVLLASVPTFALALRVPASLAHAPGLCSSRSPVREVRIVLVALGVLRLLVLRAGLDAQFASTPGAITPALSVREVRAAEVGLRRLLGPVFPFRYPALFASAPKGVSPVRAMLEVWGGDINIRLVLLVVLSLERHAQVATASASVPEMSSVMRESFGRRVFSLPVLSHVVNRSFPAQITTASFRVTLTGAMVNIVVCKSCHNFAICRLFGASLLITQSLNFFNFHVYYH